jgi:hypothetical protein
LGGAVLVCSAPDVDVPFAALLRLLDLVALLVAGLDLATRRAAVAALAVAIIALLTQTQLTS